MNLQLLEELLHEDESSSLDFKREQYRFDSNNEEVRSELLKDILAFANAWRRVDAYILIGVDEVKGGRSKVLGIQKHFDDADLQQFVNCKTQRPIEFSYEAFPIEGKQIGIIIIPRWELIAEFGKIQPQAKSWSDDTFYIAASRSCEVDLSARIFADNLPSPLIVPFHLQFSTSKRQMVHQDVEGFRSES